jgi:cob(I)alamin adenosyltransferase
MKIYTRSGDKGKTSLKGGKKVPKYHKRIRAVGNVDELISYMGLIRSQNINDEYKKILIMIQEKLMNCTALLVSDSSKSTNDLSELTEEDIKMLEREIDKMEKDLPPLDSFILPGGHTTISFCHIARSVCRKAERKVVKLAAKVDIPEIIIKYINRLSDYLYVLSRRLSVDLSVKEILWKP